MFVLGEMNYEIARTFFRSGVIRKSEPEFSRAIDKRVFSVRFRTHRRAGPGAVGASIARILPSQVRETIEIIGARGARR